MIDAPRLHDCFFEGLRLTGKSARLFFRDLDNKEYELDLGSVEYLLANEFREGNIILDLTIDTGKACDVTRLQSLFDDEHIRKNHDFLTKLLHRIESEELTLVSIDPSYGSAFVALCKTATWRIAKSI